jgi:hypothetical protein
MTENRITTIAVSDIATLAHTAHAVVSMLRSASCTYDLRMVWFANSYTSVEVDIILPPAVRLLKRVETAEVKRR